MNGKQARDVLPQPTGAVTTVLPPFGRRPVVVCFTPGIAAVLAASGLACEVVAWRKGHPPPDDHRADVCLGGNLVDETALPWARGATWVHLNGVGHDNAPAGLLTGRVVTNSPGAGAVPVAEFALAAILAAAKRLPEVWTAGPEASYRDFPLDELEGQTLGIVGYGHIGHAVAARAAAFGLRLLVHTRTPTTMSAGPVFCALPDLAARADHLVLAATATPQTHHLVNATLLRHVKPGLHLVNVSRGSLVDQDALRSALDSGQVARATLDTVDPEPLPAGHWLRRHPRVRLSPHIAAVTVDANRRAVERFAVNFDRYLSGQPLLNVVGR